MKRWISFLAVVIAMGMAAGDLYAQPGRGGFGGGPGGGPGGGAGGFGGGPLGVIRDQRVREELGITEDQYEKLQELQRKAGEQTRELFSGLRDLSDEERRERFAQLRDKVAQQQEDLQKQIDTVLLPQQRDRLKQISLQQRMRFGAQNALTSPEVAKELGITDAQREQLQKAAQEAEEELRTKTEELREQARQKVLNVLTPSQQEKLKQLIGEPANLGGPGAGGQRFGGRQGQGGQGPRQGGRQGGRIQRPADGD